MQEFKRIIKTELVDASGRRMNPAAAFTRFGFWPTGPRSYFAVLRTIEALGIFLSMMIDWGLVDTITRTYKKPNDGDRVPFWLRPPDWINSNVLTILVACLLASGIKRKDTDNETDYPGVYLFIWNSLIASIPLCAASFIIYFGVLRWDASEDKAYEVTLGFSFAACCFELLFGGWPVSRIDVCLPTILAVLFILYTVLLARFGTIEFPQLNWNESPQKALINSIIFLLIELICASVTVIVAHYRNACFNIHQPPREGGMISMTLA